jgi:hypothetical protein
MAGKLDPELLSAENERMEQVLRLLEPFMSRRAQPAAGPADKRPGSSAELKRLDGESWE